MQVLGTELFEEKARYECLEAQFRDYERENVELENKLTILESKINGTCGLSDDLTRSQEYNSFVEEKIMLQKMKLAHMEEIYRRQSIHIGEMEQELQVSCKIHV